MIEERKGNLFTAEEGLIVHGCNARGVMGSGVAEQVKELFPKACEVYEDSGYKLGTISHYQVNKDIAIVNAVTQKFYGFGERYTNYEAVATCFEQINKLALEIGAKQVHFPLIGAYRGGGNWVIISTIIEETLDPSIKLILWKL